MTMNIKVLSIIGMGFQQAFWESPSDEHSRLWALSCLIIDKAPNSAFSYCHSMGPVVRSL